MAAPSAATISSDPVLDALEAQSIHILREVAGAFRRHEGETPELRQIRFRTLGCYPLTAGVESTADDLGSLIDEMVTDRMSERAGRLIDDEGGTSMKSKKSEGYF